VLGGTALQEQHLVVRRNRHQRAQISLCLLGKRDEVLATMADLHHRCTGAGPLQHLVAGLLQNRFGNGTWARGKIVCATHKHSFEPGLAPWLGLMGKTQRDARCNTHAERDLPEATISA
jgi:hypothetical protein